MCTNEYHFVEGHNALKDVHDKRLFIVPDNCKDSVHEMVWAHRISKLVLINLHSKILANANYTITGPKNQGNESLDLNEEEY